MSREQILAAIPHRPPFLWVDEVVEQTEDTIKTTKWVDPAEPFFQGHYPDFPICPGVLVCEAIYQAGAVLLSSRAADQLAEGQIPVLARAKDSRFKRMVRPGDTLEVTVELTDTLGSVYHLSGKARVNGELAVSSKFTCAIVPKPSEG